jgi:Tol biopolymer transport system component
VGETAPNVPAGQIVYVSNNEIYVANTDGTGVQQLTTDTFNDQAITVSRDGQRVVFVSDRDVANGGGQDLYLFSIDDPTNITRLTTTASNEADPVWSHDGNMIAYVSTAEGASTTDIFVIDTDDLTKPPLLLTTGTEASNEFQPTWSPDSNIVAFVSDRNPGNNEIYTQRLDGNDAANPTRLTDDGADDRDPAWARDGSGIAFTSDRNGDDDIFIMQSNGSGVQQLTEDEANESQPTWSDDSQYIIYFTEAEGGALYIMRRDGTQKARLAAGATTGVWRVSP